MRLQSSVFGASLTVLMCCAQGVFSGRAAATTMLPLDLPALTARAEVVIAGKVTDVRSAWTADHGAIFTDVTIHVDRVLAGSVKIGEDVVVRREGGSVDGVGMKVYGAASFGKDEDVVVFIERRGASRYVVGMAQGKLKLYTDSMGTRRLHRDLSEITYTRAAAPSERKLSARPGSDGVAAPIDSLDELAGGIARLKTAARP